jgi:hypothetical protein
LDQPGKISLITTGNHENNNRYTIPKLFDGSIFILRPSGISHDDVLLFLFDAALSMVKSMSNNCSYFQNYEWRNTVNGGITKRLDQQRSNLLQVRINYNN